MNGVKWELETRRYAASSRLYRVYNINGSRADGADYNFWVSARRAAVGGRLWIVRHAWGSAALRALRGRRFRRGVDMRRAIQRALQPAE